MHKFRPWIYFVLFCCTLAGLSVFRDKAPELYTDAAGIGTVLWALGIVILSVAAIQRAFNRTVDVRDPGGFGFAALPLPRKWKAWMYDEPVNRLPK